MDSPAEEAEPAEPGTTTLPGTASTGSSVSFSPEARGEARGGHGQVVGSPLTKDSR